MDAASLPLRHTTCTVFSTCTLRGRASRLSGFRIRVTPRSRFSSEALIVRWRSGSAGPRPILRGPAGGAVAGLSCRARLCQHADMNRRLQVLVPEELNARVEEAARRGQTSKAAWVRQAIGDALKRHSAIERDANDPLARLASLNAPTADIEGMIAEIEFGQP